MILLENTRILYGLKLNSRIKSWAKNIFVELKISKPYLGLIVFTNDCNMTPNQNRSNVGRLDQFIIPPQEGLSFSDSIHTSSITEPTLAFSSNSLA